MDEVKNNIEAHCITPSWAKISYINLLEAVSELRLHPECGNLQKYAEKMLNYMKRKGTKFQAINRPCTQR
jgi:hypothetical protein